MINSPAARLKFINNPLSVFDSIFNFMTILSYGIAANVCICSVPFKKRIIVRHTKRSLKHKITNQYVTGNDAYTLLCVRAVIPTLHEPNGLASFGLREGSGGLQVGVALGQFFAAVNR